MHGGGGRIYSVYAFNLCAMTVTTNIHYTVKNIVKKCCAVLMATEGGVIQPPKCKRVKEVVSAAQIIAIFCISRMVML